LIYVTEKTTVEECLDLLVSKKSSLSQFMTKIRNLGLELSICIKL